MIITPSPHPYIYSSSSYYILCAHYAKYMHNIIITSITCMNGTLCTLYKNYFYLYNDVL